MTRSALLARGAVAAAVAFGTGAAAPFVTSAFAQAGDLQILEFALTLEYLETDFYRRSARLVLGPEAARIARRHAVHEQQHTDALMALLEKLGGRAPERPTFTFPAQDEKGFLKLAQTVEETGVSAYNGATPLLRSRELVAAFASIVQVEARHAAAIRLARIQPVSPEAFDKPVSQTDARAAIKPLIAP